MNNRHAKLEEALRIAAAEFLVREANRSSLITVTVAEVSEDGRNGKIFITVFPDTAETSALEFANRSRGEFGKFFLGHVRGARVPHLEFVIDKGEKMRQRLDELTN